jgi:polyisoprenyl-phosphate glycosyltransferase
MGLGAVQLICVGLLGEYVARIFTTVQARPTYSVGYDSLDQDLRDRDELTVAGPEPAGRPPAGT